MTEHVATLIEVEVQGGLTCSRDYDPSIPDLSGDREQLIQAVLKRRPQRHAGNARVRSAAAATDLKNQNSTQLHHCRSASQGLCRLDIMDTGPGISDDIKERIFFPMISGRSEGTGLGLTIAQSAINVHQGIIECDSEPGSTRFSIYLPIKA